MGEIPHFGNEIRNNCVLAPTEEIDVAEPTEGPPGEINPKRDGERKGRYSFLLAAPMGAFDFPSF